MKILHLGFEDPRKPDSGGCAKRSHSINRRLSARHDITVLTTTYSGAKPGVLDGVRYLPVGHGNGRVAALSYWAAIVPHVRRTDANLVVEEFNPPFGSGFVPLYSPAPVVASVGWLFADAMQRKYHLPFLSIQNHALPLYRNFITVTQGMAQRLQREVPSSQSWYVPNGLDEEDFAPRTADTGDILLLGRLDIGQKGIDTALEVIASLPPMPGRLLIAGEGRDRAAIESRIKALELDSRVQLLGSVYGEAKTDLLRGARVLLMPSRYETFGIVALEAFAVGCPVVGFDIPGLSEVATGPAARLVPEGNTSALGDALAQWWRDAPAAMLAGTHGPAVAYQYRWDEIALRQETVYQQIAVQAERRAA